MSHLSKIAVRRMLLERIGAILRPHGFRARPKPAHGFVRRIEEGCQILSVAVWDYRPRFEFSVVMGVRLEGVEEFVAPFCEVEPRYRAETWTSLTQLEHLGLKSNDPKGVVFGGDDERSLEAAIDSLCVVIRESVLPFFEQYDNLQEIERGLNPPGAEQLKAPIWPIDWSRFDGSNEPYRAIRGIASAYLAGGDSAVRLPALMTAYRGQLSEMIPEIRRKYEACAAYILSRIEGA